VAWRFNKLTKGFKMNVKGLSNIIANEEYLNSILSNTSDKNEKINKVLEQLNNSSKEEIGAIVVFYCTCNNQNLKNLLCSLCVGAMIRNTSNCIITNKYMFTSLFKCVLSIDQFAQYYFNYMISPKDKSDFLDLINDKK
jgi:hypothetical protein